MWFLDSRIHDFPMKSNVWWGCKAALLVLCLQTTALNQQAWLLLSKSQPCGVTETPKLTVMRWTLGEDVLYGHVKESRFWILPCSLLRLRGGAPDGDEVLRKAIRELNEEEQRKHRAKKARCVSRGPILTVR
jgi:hypothetical protein